MSRYVLDFREIDATNSRIVGGKAAALGELSRIPAARVPDGFCVTTEAYRRVTGGNHEFETLLDRLSPLSTEAREEIADICDGIRTVVEGLALPDDLAGEIADHLSRLGAEQAYAIRSSATAEDLPTASFAGQQDTYLNVSGLSSILTHIRRCWASLFTERAVVYRIRNGFDHRKVQQAVVVQRMVFPEAAGIMFTADPVTSNRKVVSIDAAPGLGEAVVGGLVTPDTFKVRDGRIMESAVSTKRLAIRASKHGGTEQMEIAPEHQVRPALTDGQVLELERIGRAIEAHFGHPQDIEWCLADGNFHIVQSRPITTLFPIPASGAPGNRVYVSVGHQQMMTDPMKPLGLSFFLLTTRAPMCTAAGRLFVDVTGILTSPSGRNFVIDTLGRGDPLIGDALLHILDRGDFINPPPPAAAGQAPGSAPQAWSSAEDGSIGSDPAIVADLIRKGQAALDELKAEIRTRSGTDLFDFIREDIQRLQKSLFESVDLIKAAMEASWWLNEKVEEWLGEKNVADALTQSVPNNVTSEMGLALLEVADAIRPHPQVVEYLRTVESDDFLDGLTRLYGGDAAREAIHAFLDRYGMRCSGEIDITRTRWSESPSTLIPLILSNVRNFAPGEAERRWERGRREALAKEREILARLRQMPDGETRARETKRKIDLVRNFIGFREYPKYGMVSRYFIYKQALMEEADRLVRAGVVTEKEDVFYLSLDEFREAVRTMEVDRGAIEARREEYESFKRLNPPRVITSDGEIVTGSYRRGDRPDGALIGLAVSAGVVEGRARVVLAMEDAVLDEGDILVTRFTDPSWTPLFVSVAGLVTEVGGLMTHGAVIAREYGLPAVVGVEDATDLIRDGQRIRVNGTDGYVELL